MIGLVQELAGSLRAAIRDKVANLEGAKLELRVVFHGPPLDILEKVFDLLVVDGGLRVQRGSGDEVLFPVLLQVPKLSQGRANPEIGISGVCDEAHLLTLRNSPHCPRYVALVPPGLHTNLSVSTTTSDLGLAAASNAGNATIEDWWRDEFIQELVRKSLLNGFKSPGPQLEQAKRMVEHAVRAADEIDRHRASRRLAWSIVARLFGIPVSTGRFSEQVCVVCGFPPSEDGELHAEEQKRVLHSVASVFVDDGFSAAVKKLKERAEEDVGEALDAFLGHLHAVCDVPPDFERASPFFYAPSIGDEFKAAPPWWLSFTVERWSELLEEDPPQGALQVECLNSLVPYGRGTTAVVRGMVELAINLENRGEEQTQVAVERQGGQRLGRTWQLAVRGKACVSDEEVPTHTTPIRYIASAEGYKPGSLKIVSLANWDPGLVVYCKTAIKTGVPKKARVRRGGPDFEAALLLSGRGRHYIELLVRDDVSVGSVATGNETTGLNEVHQDCAITKLSDHVLGFEVSVEEEGEYDLKFDRGNGQETLRFLLTSDETTAVGCKSEFEKLILRNRQLDKARAMADVQVERQLRIMDLQGWILDAKNIKCSFHPLVLAPDSARRWGTPNWQEDGGTILSLGRFLHDPRPAVGSMQPPRDFVEARVELASMIRGQDGTGVAEAAVLSDWMAKPESAEQVEKYLSSYLRWLESDPDSASWADLILAASLDADPSVLSHEPDAVLLSPLHPVRLAWQALAQQVLHAAYRTQPCPAASILDPDMVPDAIVLPLRTAAGGVKRQLFISVECSSDYWGVLWNGSRLDRIPARTELAPFDGEFGISVGGVSSGFSVSQVQRALDDVSEILSAKPVLNVAISSASGQSSACNEGVFTWCRERLGAGDGDDGRTGEGSLGVIGPRYVHFFDERKSSSRPDDASISNLAEDSSNTIRWFDRIPSAVKPDLGIFAQLETSAPSVDPMEAASPMGFGGLLRHRIRRQLIAGGGSFLSESRMGDAGPPTGEGLADKLSQAIAFLENHGHARAGYTFAPSVHAISAMLNERNADFAAVSSTAVDPACFLGSWLKGAYLWDYELPSYSQRAGDTNGYYLLSKVKPVDQEALRRVLGRLPGCGDLDDNKVSDVILEVARRGIPTVRGMSSGDSGAAGDLGLFLASRLLQDEFRAQGQHIGGLQPVLQDVDGRTVVSMILPVDPFRGYLDDMRRAIEKTSMGLRPDFLVASLSLTGPRIDCRLTPVEVKYRQSMAMTNQDCKDALSQACSLSSLLEAIRKRCEVAGSGSLLWKLGYQHLLLTMLDFGFRVYSQQWRAAASGQWTELHQRTSAAILAGELALEIDQQGRLIAFDGSPYSGPKDVDGDSFQETIVISQKDAAAIATGDPGALFEAIKKAVGQWNLLPSQRPAAGQMSKQDPQSIAGPATSAGDRTGGTIEGVKVEPSVGTTVQPEAVDIAKGKADEIEASAGEKSSGVEHGIRLHIGRTSGAFNEEERYLDICDTRLNQLNMGVVGDLGTGKTQLLKSLIYQIRQGAQDNQGVVPRFLIFDYKKDYSAEDFVTAVGARVVNPYRLPLNLFDVSGAETFPPWLDRYTFFSDVLDKIFSGIGPVQRMQLKQAVKSAYEAASEMGRQATLYDIHYQYRNLLGNKPDSPLSIIDDLVDMELFDPDQTKTSGFGDFFDGVVVISLNALGQDDRRKNMLVAIMLNMFYEYMLKLPKRKYRGVDPQLRTVDSYLLVDEADNIMCYEFDVLKRILLQGREFGVGVILASQYLKHFKAGGTDYREPLLTWFIHKVPNITPQELGALGLTKDLPQLADQVKSLANHYCLYKTANVGGEILRGTPFFEVWKPS